MKLAIHNGAGWNIKWLEYCQVHNIPYIKVDCYDSNIINILLNAKITHLLWHFNHANPTDILMARYVLFAVDKMNIKTFPNYDTSWHFDDKVAQKYILESVSGAVVDSWVFYKKEKALTWLRNEAIYPLVAKLRRGAGSHNVRLINSFKEAKNYTDKMFGHGIQPVQGYISDASTHLRLSKDINVFKRKLKKLPDYLLNTYLSRKQFPKEKGYVYFQEFIKNNKNDIRVAIVGDKIWAYKREVREGDFRASGSGKMNFDLSDIPIRLIKDSYDLSKKLNTQSIAFDYVKDSDDNYYIVEMSYGFGTKGITNSKGYWNSNLNFIEESCDPVCCIIEDFIKS